MKNFLLTLMMIGFCISQFIMQCSMSSFIGKEQQIFYSIIMLFSVYMMHKFFRGKKSSDMFFHNKTMLPNISSFIRKRMARIVNFDIFSGIRNATIPIMSFFSFLGITNFFIHLWSSFHRCKIYAFIFGRTFLRASSNIFSNRFDCNNIISAYQTLLNNLFMGISAFSRTVFCSIKSSFYNVKFFFTNKANFIHKVSFVGLLIITVSALTCQVSSADQWDKSRPDSTDAKIDWPAASVANNDALDRGLSNYREGLVLTYSSATTISATPGEIVVSNAAGSLRLMLANTASTNITFSDLDTGAEAASTTYYVYAVAASGAAEVATFKISLSSAAPGSETYYKKIGSFYNDASSNIDIAQIVNDNVDSNVRDVRDFSTSGSSYTVKDIGDLKIAYGTLTVSGTSAALTNLPFSSASSYSITGTFGTANTPTEAVTIVPSSGSAATVYSGDNLSQAIRWFAIGT